MTAAALYARHFRAALAALARPRRPAPGDMADRPLETARIDGQVHEVRRWTMTGRELLALTGKSPHEWDLFRVLGPRRERVPLDSEERLIGMARAACSYETRRREARP